MKQVSIPLSGASAPAAVLRVSALALCVLAVSGCSTVKGWFDGKD